MQVNSQFTLTGRPFVGDLKICPSHPMPIRVKSGVAARQPGGLRPQEMHPAEETARNGDMLTRAVSHERRPDCHRAVGTVSEASCGRRNEDTARGRPQLWNSKSSLLSIPWSSCVGITINLTFRS